MRIVMIAPFGIRPKGTLLARMLPLAQALHRRGHTVTILAPPVHNPADGGTTRDYSGVTVTHTPTPPLGGPPAALWHTVALWSRARRLQPDVLHLFKPKGFGGLAVLARGRVPLVVDCDDWEGSGGWNDLLPYPPPAKALFAWQERDLPRRAGAVTVVSHTLETLVWAMGVPPQRVFYLPNGAPATEPLPLQPTPHPTILLYTRFWELDLAEVATALATIHRARPDARLLLIGKGERGEEQQLLALATTQGWAAMIDNRGWQEPAAIPQLLASADVALAPIRDTLINRARGMAKLVELLAAGLPIVASDVGTARDYLAPDAGILTPPGDAQALAAATLELLADETARTRLRAAARAASHRLAWPNLAPIAEAAYQQATVRA
ncbi:glycosyltransferase family 4 protein [uncultured Chloroflexus sp.]|uniref:glycosyltransferase family 4 protein n=1 Tax=uncultured Chloroflexus sp. TaxID=214040 RepID=UPI0026320C83|nr:glycosyltransferase family 4 protein [uncultured Chloroflexus sp.]